MVMGEMEGVVSHVVSSFAALICCAGAALAQPAPGGRFAEMEKKALAEPFVGVTTDGKPAPGLFGIASTGVATGGVQKAAADFIATLSDTERAETLYALDADEWRRWMNVSVYPRRGKGFKDMSDRQKQAAIGLLRAGLSARSLKLSQDIMKLNETLAELNNDWTRYGEGLYWVTVMGTPSATEPWGWQLDGHHLVINYFVLGDQVVMTPTFVGSEPIIAKGGKYAGTVVMQAEQDKGFALISALDSSQRTKAIIRADKTANDNQTEAWKDNAIVPVAGVPARELNATQRDMLIDLMATYIGYMDDGHAAVKMAEAARHIEDTYFAWAGPTTPGGVFYYRIQSPVILIEFDHQTPANLKGPPVPYREHIHAVIRTPNGNDYGKDLLRQHLAAHPH